MDYKNAKIPADLHQAADQAIEDGRFPGVRSVSELVQDLLKHELRKQEVDS